MNQTQKSQLILITFLSIFAFTAKGQNKTVALDDYYSALSRSGQFNGNVLIAENGKIVYEKSFGYADYSARKPNTVSTTFPIASVTKTMTSVAVMQLVEKGKLKLSDVYSQYFPSFPYPTVTIKELLSHTSRIPSSRFYRYLDSLQKLKDTFYTNSDVIPAFVALKTPLVGEPKPEGDRSPFSYSNINYHLLALLIEKVSGMPYQGYLRKYIFFPAGMDNSSFSEFYFGIDRNICREQRWRYLFSEAPERIDTTSDNAYIFSTYNFKGHGDVVSTVRDLLKYEQALEKNILLKRGTLLQAYTPVVYGNPGNSGYGLGWSILHDSTKGKVVFHHGGGIGMEVMFIRDIVRHQTVILFDNMKNPAFYVGMNALKILNGERIPLAKKSIAKAYGREIAKGNFTEARNLLKKLGKDSANYELSNYHMNLLGYQFMEKNMNDKALEVLKTNVELFPDNWNSYDSYGEILLKAGRKEEAIKMYERSVELNPKNEEGKKIIKRIRTQEQ